MPNKSPIIVFGAGGHALVVADIIQLEGRYQIAGFLDDQNIERHNSHFAGSKIIGDSRKLNKIRSSGIELGVVAIGNCNARIKAAEMLKDAGFSLVNCIHPKSCIADGIQIGTGCVITANAVINPGSQIGDNVIVNTGATIDHECNIESGSHIGPGAHLAGHVHIGKRTWIGIGCIVSDHISIGSGSYIGAGAVVVQDIPANTLAYGVPARLIKKID